MNNFFKSEILALLTASMFVWCLKQYFETGSKIILGFEIFWFIVMVGFMWYGMYKRLEEKEPTQKINEVEK